MDGRQKEKKTTIKGKTKNIVRSLKEKEEQLQQNIKYKMVWNNKWKKKIGNWKM